MTEIAGYNGQVDLAGVVDSDVSYNTHSWSLDITGDAHDVTNFTTTGWRKQARGLNGWSGTVELYTDATNRVVPSDVNSEVTGTFYISDTTDYLTGKCLISGWHPAAAVDGIETQSIDVTGSSDLFASA